MIGMGEKYISYEEAARLAAEYMEKVEKEWKEYREKEAAAGLQYYELPLKCMYEGCGEEIDALELLGKATKGHDVGKGHFFQTILICPKCRNIIAQFTWKPMVWTNPETHKGYIYGENMEEIPIESDDDLERHTMG